MATIDLMDRFGNLGHGGIKNNGVLDAEVLFQPALRTMRTDFIQVKTGDSIVYKNMNGIASTWNILSFYTGEAQGSYVSGIAGQTTPQSGVWTAAKDGYVRLFGSFPAGDKISVTMTDLAPDVEDYLAQYNAMNYRFLPNSIPKIVAHIQEYLSDHPIADSTTLQSVIDAAFKSYMEEIQETADTYIAEAVPPAAAAAVDAAASPALQEITAKAAEAAESAREAALSEQSAEMSEENALSYRNQAQQIKDSISAEVSASVLAAQEQATLAQESAQAADQSADTAELLVAQARAQAEAAADHAQTASGYASDAHGYMQDASGYAQNASDYADNAAQSAATFSTDPTLTISGKAADAKATGDELSALKNSLSDIYIYNDPVKLTGWSQGYIRKDGSQGAGNDACRTSYKSLDGVFAFTIASGLKCSCYEYSAQDASGYVGQLFSAQTGTFLQIFNAEHYYRFVITKTDGTDILVADVSADAVIYAKRTNTDITLTKSGIAADAEVTGNRIAENTINIKVNDDTSQNTLFSPNYYKGTVSTPNNNDGGAISDSSTAVYSDEIYVGDVFSVSITPPLGYSFRVAAYDESHTYIRVKSIRPETTEKTVISVFDRPKVTGFPIIKYIRIVFKRTDSGAITDSDITAIKSASVLFTANASVFFNAKRLNNQHIESMTHQGYNLTSGTHSNTNRMTSFWGAYQRGFDACLCNVKFTSDGIGVLNHENTITVGGITYTIQTTEYSVLASAFESAGSYLPTFDDIVWFCKMVGMNIFVANQYGETGVNLLWSVLKKYQMQRKMRWLVDAETVGAVLAKDSKAKVYFYLQPSGSTASEIMNSITTDINSINDVATENKNADFYLWMEPVLISGTYTTFADALILINALLADNVFTGVCNVNSQATYKRLAPYITAFHSDFITSGNCVQITQDAIIEKFPILSDYARME